MKQLTLGKVENYLENRGFCYLFCYVARKLVYPPSCHHVVSIMTDLASNVAALSKLVSFLLLSSLLTAADQLLEVHVVPELQK